MADVQNRLIRCDETLNLRAIDRLPHPSHNYEAVMRSTTQSAWRRQGAPRAKEWGAKISLEARMIVRFALRCIRMYLHVLVSTPLFRAKIKTAASQGRKYYVLMLVPHARLLPAPALPCLRHSFCCDSTFLYFSLFLFFLFFIFPVLF